MMHLIPGVKHQENKNGILGKKAINYNKTGYDKRILQALAKLPYDDNGTCLEIEIEDGNGEAYELQIDKDNILIKANGLAGAFYAIQTLRQIFKHDEVPCLYIKDEPDFKYRGFYHDVTRGKIPTVDTLKHLIDEMAYYKLNSLQLYVEHTYEFEETKELIKKTGYLSKEELLELEEYCQEHFVEFIPSLSTFGHLYELLEQEQYQHLRIVKEFEKKCNFWRARMEHHTIDPLNPESIEVIQSLIDQYYPVFESEYFNICCDETFDLKCYPTESMDEARLYIDFVKKIIEHVESKNKKVMMWADILLEHPETIEELSEDICFLNWNYDAEPSEEKIKYLAKKGRKQIVCPGTTTWNRLCENVEVEESNISLMAEYGYKHGAIGVLNTNWGDWGNPCCIELAMYGLVLGAAKSWDVQTKISDEFYESVNKLLYGKENAVQCLKEMSEMHQNIGWVYFCKKYFTKRYGKTANMKPWNITKLQKVQNTYSDLKNKLEREKWDSDEYRQEMLLAAEGICVMAELYAKLEGIAVTRMTDTEEWLKKYRTKWMQKNKESELCNIEELFRYCEAQ